MPRRLLPEMTYSITRRCVDRRLFLLPTPEVNEVLLYSLGRALQNRRVELHVYSANTNHDHSVMTDRPKGMPEPPGLTEAQRESADLPGFMGHFRSLTGRALNTHYGRGENFWRVGSYDSCELWNMQSQIDQCLYAWTQVVRDGLVERIEDWPGVVTLPEDFGTTIRVAKPKNAFFGGRGKDRVVPTDPYALAHWTQELADAEEAALRLGRERDKRKKQRKRNKAKPGRGAKRGRALDKARRRRARKKKLPAPKPKRDRSRLPDFVEIDVVPPPAFQHWPIEKVRTFFREELDRELERIRAEREREGKSVMGIEAVMAQNPRDAAGPTWPTFARNPRVCCSKDKELRLRVLRGLQDWRYRYRIARQALKSGKDVVFPEGTYHLRRFHDVRVRTGSGPPLRAA